MCRILEIYITDYTTYSDAVGRNTPLSNVFEKTASNFTRRQGKSFICCIGFVYDLTGRTIAHGKQIRLRSVSRVPISHKNTIPCSASSSLLALGIHLRCSTCIREKNRPTCHRFSDVKIWVSANHARPHGSSLVTLQ